MQLDFLINPQFERTYEGNVRHGSGDSWRMAVACGGADGTGVWRSTGLRAPLKAGVAVGWELAQWRSCCLVCMSLWVPCLKMPKDEA